MSARATPKTSVILADDEPLARERLRTLLAAEPWVEIVAECDDVASTIAAIETLRPRLAFLDVQMPGGTGFDVVAAIEPDRMPLVIFVTAYDHYALRAFDVHAVDYLLKPFDRERFQQALARTQRQLEAEAHGDLQQRLLQLVEDLRPAAAWRERFVVRSAGRVFFVRGSEIDWIESAGNYVKLHVGSDTHLLRDTMHSMEASLDPDLFIRVHRSYIVNIERVRELQPWFNGEYVILLCDGTRLTLSRGYREKLQERLGRPL